MSARDKLKAAPASTTQKDTSSEKGVRGSVQRVGQKNKVKFARTKMWVNYILSLLQKDRGCIPENIGNRILITNNMYITRHYLSSIVHVVGLSLDTPVVYTSKILKYLRDNACDAVVDVTIKNADMKVNLKESGLKSRIEVWESLLDDPNTPAKEKDVAARCLYTRDIAAEGNKLMRSRIFLTIRAKSGSELSNAEKLVFRYLNQISAEYDLISGDLKEKLAYISILSDKAPANIKDIKAVINSTQTLAQMLPNSGAFNGEKGIYMGNDIVTNNPFNLDLGPIASARNIYLVSSSGDGKTVLATNMACSAAENGMAVCVQDIKGNEFNNFINATGGYIVSLRRESTGYINSWRMNPEDTTDDAAEDYFRQRVFLSIEQMLILAAISDPNKRSRLEELLNTFHDSVYISLGVLPSNRNSWVNTKHLTPFKIYDMFIGYMTPEMQRRYDGVADDAINNLRMVMSREGNKSYIFKQEFDYLSILRAPTLMFDFGMLEGATTMTDPTLFKLKFLYMTKLNADYIAYKYSKGIKVFKILEESQIAVTDPEIMRGYVEEFTLRRAQGQTTLMLGNSVSALTNNSLSEALIENVKAVLIGGIGSDARKIVTEKFSLEEYSDAIDMVDITSDNKYCFLFINRMQKKSLTPILKIELSEDKKYKLLTPVPQNRSAVM